MQNIEKMPVIIKKYPSKGLPPIEFNTFELGDLPSKWSVKIDQQASDKWNSFFDHLGDDMLSKEYAHQDIMYYPGMNSTAPYRNYGGPLTRYVVQNYGPIPINKKITFKGSVTDKYVKRGNGFVTFQLSTYSDNNVLLQKHWRTFMLPSTESDRANYNESNENNTLIQDENILKKFTNMKLICDQDRFNNIEGPGESTAHTDLNIAKARGMPNTTAQACISIAIINRFLTKQFGNKFFTNGFYDIKLIKPTFAGEVMNCNGILLNKSDEDALCKLTIETDDKRLVTVGYGGIEKRD
tara:strand:- start:101 stop:988 length:888 start_codon:yes stop_codon:yes gene_type:complete